MCTSISYCTALQIWSLAVGGTSELVRIVPNWMCVCDIIRGSTALLYMCVASGGALVCT